MEAIRPEDGRNQWQRMSRREIWRALDKANIPYPTGCTSEDGIKLLQANQINPMEAIEWEQIQVKDEKGNISIEHYPKRKEPQYSEADIMKRDAEMEQRLQDAAAKANEEAIKKASKRTNDLEGKVDQLADQVAALTQALLQQQEKKNKPKETDPHKMKYMAFKKWCKDRGHELQKGEDRDELIAKLEAKKDGQDPS